MLDDVPEDTYSLMRVSQMTTLLLTRKEVEQLLSPAALLPELRTAFESYSLERSIAAQRARSPLPGQKNSSAMILFPGLLKQVPAYRLFWV